MKQIVVLLLCVVGCGRAEQDPEALRVLAVEAQEVVDITTQAIVHGDVEQFKTRWRPSLYEEGGYDTITRDRAVQEWMEAQREGLMAWYGETPPKVVDVKDVLNADGEFSVRISPDGTATHRALSPKPLHFWKDSASGKVYYAGLKIPKVPEDHGNVLRQGACSWSGTSPVSYNWDMCNDSQYTHAIRANSAVNVTYIPMCGPPPGCGSTYCDTDNGASGMITQYDVPHNQSGYWGIMSWPYPNGQRVIGQITPSYSACTCAGATTSTASNSCCWVHAYGWDLWWYSTDVGINMPPRCSQTSWCPGQ